MADATQEAPGLGDLRHQISQKPLPQLDKTVLSRDTLDANYVMQKALECVSRLEAALQDGNSEKLADCFFSAQSYWKDNLALTCHLRTFENRKVIAAALLHTSKLRSGIQELALAKDSAVFVPATPTLQFIDCDITFRTTAPAASCSGRLVLLPQQDDSGQIQWRVWTLFTRLEALDLQREDEKLLLSPRVDFAGQDSINVDVLIVGAGNAAAALSARLKALGIESLMLERNANAGDNWALRYDCLQFHVPTSFCELPFMTYEHSPDEPRRLSRDSLAGHLRKFVNAFNLNVVTSANVIETTYDECSKTWRVTFTAPRGISEVSCKQLVLATGVGSQKPNLPLVADEASYDGLSIHSAEYKNAGALRCQNINSVAIIGSANTAFDVAEDCVKAGLHATMVVRSPTYVVPIEYIVDQRSLGSYDLGVEMSDRMYLTLPIVVDAALGQALFAMMASQEPSRYESARAAGFPLLDSTDPSCALMHNLVERGGGHYVDIGGTKLIDEGKIEIKAQVEPTAFTEKGLKLSDGSHLEADAVIWCTGFKDKDVRDVAAEILGSVEEPRTSLSEVLDARSIVSRMDHTWGIDSEGEIRGLWKRHARLDNFWIMGGYTQQHRWHSKTLALQIQAKLGSVLGEAYRGTPEVASID